MLGGLTYIIWSVYNFVQAHKIITFRDDGRRDLGSASATASADLQSSRHDKLETQYLQRLEVTSVSIMQSA